MMRQIVYALSWMMLVVGCNNTQPQVVDAKPTQDKTVVILGTYNWDVETNSLKSDSNSDFWYQRVNATQGNLIAQNGTMVEVVNKPYNKIDKQYIASLPALRDGRIDSHALKVGTVAIFKTAEGHYGKLKIKGFKSLHDFNFPEANRYLDDSWKSFVLRKPNTKKYHLVLEYKLYR
jgi:hypothetical protein